MMVWNTEKKYNKNFDIASKRKRQALEKEVLAPVTFSPYVRF